MHLDRPTHPAACHQEKPPSLIKLKRFSCKTQSGPFGKTEIAAAPSSSALGSMSDKDYKDTPINEDDEEDPLNPPLPAEATTDHTTPEGEGQQEEEDDEERKPPALRIRFEDHPSEPEHYPPMPGNHGAVSNENYHDPIQASMSYIASDYSPYTNHPYAIPYGFPEHDLLIGYDTSTQAGETPQHESGTASTSPAEGVVDVDFQRIASLRSSSNDLEGDEEALPLGFDSMVARRPSITQPPSSDNHPSYLQDPFLFSSSLDLPPYAASLNLWPYTGQSIAYPHLTTPTTPTRYVEASSTHVDAADASVPVEDDDDDDDDDSSLDKKPAAKASTRKSKAKPKAKTTKAPPKKKSKPKKRRTRAGRDSNGSSSSSSPGGASYRHNDYSHIAPDPELLAEAHTERARNALESWYQRLRELLRFRDEHGHTLVPQKYPKNPELGVWVNKQRMEKKAYDEPNPKSSINPIKIQALENAGFVWAKPKGTSAWEQKYQELQQYVKQKGDPNVPTKYKGNRALGRWVSTQRNMYKRYTSGGVFKNLRPDEIVRRIKLLEELGFVWIMGPPSGSEKDEKNDESKEYGDDQEGTGG